MQKDIGSLSNRELDEPVQRTDAAQGQTVLRRLYEFLGRYVVYPSEHAHVAHALWILHTHMMDRWDSTPRLAFLSPEKASGKSRALEVTELVVPCPVMAVNMSPAYIFRKVGSEDGATILYDEIDTVFGPKAKENEEIRALLNAGHRRGAVAGRCVVHGKEVRTEEISAYAAVALAGLGWLPDTILSRSIIVRMRPRRADEQVEQFRQRMVEPEGRSICEQLALWARSAPTEIDWPEMPPEVRDRDADVWEPLLAVADLVGGDWPSRAREAAIGLVQVAKDAEASLGVILLHDLRTVFGDADKLATEPLLKKLYDLDESPWGDMKGKPLDSRTLARRLREYGIKSKVIRIDNSTHRGYERADFLDAWSRYLPALSARSVTSVTDVTVAETSATAAENTPQKPPKTGHISHVTGVTLPAGRETGRCVSAYPIAQPEPDIPPFLDGRAPKRPNPPAICSGPDDSLDDLIK
jgi:Protein of unknown function (DUF3631)